jgi:hypothetical protein
MMAERRIFCRRDRNILRLRTNAGVMHDFDHQGQRRKTARF